MGQGGPYILLFYGFFSWFSILESAELQSCIRTLWEKSLADSGK